MANDDTIYTAGITIRAVADTNFPTSWKHLALIDGCLLMKNRKSYIKKEVFGITVKTNERVSFVISTHTFTEQNTIIFHK